MWGGVREDGCVQSTKVDGQKSKIQESISYDKNPINGYLPRIKTIYVIKSTQMKQQYSKSSKFRKLRALKWPSSDQHPKYSPSNKYGFGVQNDGNSIMYFRPKPRLWSSFLSRCSTNKYDRYEYYTIISAFRINCSGGFVLFCTSLS